MAVKKSVHMLPMRLNWNGTPAAVRGPLDAGLQFRAELDRGARTEDWPCSSLQSGDARGHRDWIARERAGLEDRAGRHDLLHDVRSPAVCPDRIAAADDLAERGQIRRIAEQLLCTAVG